MMPCSLSFVWKKYNCTMIKDQACSLYVLLLVATCETIMTIICRFSLFSWRIMLPHAMNMPFLGWDRMFCVAFFAKGGNDLDNLHPASSSWLKAVMYWPHNDQNQLWFNLCQFNCLLEAQNFWKIIFKNWKSDQNLNYNFEQLIITYMATSLLDPN